MNPNPHAPSPNVTSPNAPSPQPGTEAVARILDTACHYPVTRHSKPWRGKVFGIATDEVQLPGMTHQVTRDYLDHTGAVGIVPLRWVEGVAEVCLIRQYRHPVGAQLWEIPAGLLDIDGEDPLIAAQRELWEETDLEAPKWTILVDMFSSPGCSTEALRIYLAEDATEAAVGAVREDEEALMERRWVQLETAVGEILAGNIHSPSAIIGIMAAHTVLSSPQYQARPVTAPWFRPRAEA